MSRTMTRYILQHTQKKDHTEERQQRTKRDHNQQITTIKRREPKTACVHVCMPESRYPTYQKPAFPHGGCTCSPADTHTHIQLRCLSQLGSPEPARCMVPMTCLFNITSHHPSSPMQMIPLSQEQKDERNDPREPHITSSSYANDPDG